MTCETRVERLRTFDRWPGIIEASDEVADLNGSWTGHPIELMGKLTFLYSVASSRPDQVHQ